MAKILCPSCGATVANKPFCSECRAPLDPRAQSGEQQSDKKDRETVLDAYGFMDRALTMEDIFRKIKLVRVQVLRAPDDDSLPDTKLLRVPEKACVYFFSSAMPVPARIPAGDYTGAKLFREVGVSAALQRRDAYRACFICNMRMRPFTAPFALPDILFLKLLLTGKDLNWDNRGSVHSGLVHYTGHALKNLSLLCGDKLVGGATIQLTLRCEHPDRFMQTLVQEFIEDQEQQKKLLTPEQLENVSTRPPDGSWKAWLRKVWNKMRGVKPEPKKFSNLGMHYFTLWDLYPYLQSRFRDTLKESIRQKTAESLFDNKGDTCEAVRADIRKQMGDYLETFGLSILDVPSFEFICPEFLDHRMEEGNAAIVEKRLKLREETARLNKEANRLALEESFDDLLFEEVLARKRIQEEGETARVRDEEREKQVRRELDLETVEQEHERGRIRADRELQLTLSRLEEQQKLDLERNKLLDQVEVERERLFLAEKALQMRAEHEERQKQLDQAHELARVAAYKELDVDKARLLLAAQNPQLAVSEIVKQQGLSGDEKVNQLLTMYEAVRQANGKESTQVMALTNEIVQQAGHVLGKYMEHRQSSTSKPHADLEGEGASSPPDASRPNVTVEQVRKETP